MTLVGLSPHQSHDHEREQGGTGGGDVSSDRSMALVVRAPGDVALEQRDAPAAGPGEVLIRPGVVGLCGTDLDIVAGRIDPAYIRYPLVLGHEWSGTVAGPAGGDGLEPGTRVVGEASCRAGTARAA